MDTRNKRASVLGLAFAAGLVLPAPGSGVQGNERAQLAFCYAADNFAPPVIEQIGGGFGVEVRKRRIENRRREIENAAKKAILRQIDEEFAFEPVKPADLFVQEQFFILNPALLMENPDEQDEEDMQAMIIGLIKAGVI